MRMKFLIVDDDRYMTTLVTSVLSKHKVEVVSHTNVGDAIRDLMREDFDGVIFDLHLPGMDGLSAIPLARHLRPGINIGLMTGDASPDLKTRVLSNGADFFVRKPCDIMNIWELITVSRREEA